MRLRSVAVDLDADLGHITAAAAGTWTLGDLTVNRMGFGAMRLPQTGQALRADAAPRNRAQAITAPPPPRSGWPGRCNAARACWSSPAPATPPTWPPTWPPPRCGSVPTRWPDSRRCGF